ncbi:MAG: hypothetical protein DHS20C14_05410 [Phycisphaeraceae bacterium]|nr:MAG: hypothetical protein DHS20C14_05410 [Phycisphaeraceae bacterium]
MLRQLLDNARASLGQMTATQKLLIGSLAVIALMTLFLVVQYSARPAMVALMADDPNANLVQTLQVSGIDAKIVDGQVVVPASQRHRAVTSLGESGALPGDTRLLFQNLIEHQDWKASKEQNRQRYILALQNELARVIGGFGNVRSATVMIDTPMSTGLGRAATKSTASVTVFTKDGSGITQGTVDAVARLVAGSQSGLSPANVQVIDGSSGRSRTVTSGEDASASTYFEYAQKIEKMKEAKIQDLLGHIPGVVVSVTAHVDVTRVRSTTQRHLPKGEGTEAILSGSTDKTESMTNTNRAAEPGVRSNQQADINAAGSSTGTATETSDSTTDITVLPGTEVRDVTDPRGMPTHLAASIGVPQHWVEALVAQTKALAVVDGEELEPPTQAEVDDRFEAMRPMIEDSIRLHLVAQGPSGEQMPGELSVTMIPTLAFVPGASQAGEGGGGGSSSFMASLTGGGAGGSGAGLVELGVVGALALVALFMMFLLVRKAGRRPELPVATDIAGVPLALQTPSDLVGEVQEGDSPMEGIELHDDDIHATKVREQVTQLVGNDAKAAAALVSRWVSLDS